MAEAVVDELEVVQVEEDQRQRAGRSAARARSRGASWSWTRGGWEPGEPVGRGLLLDQAVHAGVVDRDRALGRERLHVSPSSSRNWPGSGSTSVIRPIIARVDWSGAETIGSGSRWRARRRSEHGPRRPRRRRSLGQPPSSPSRAEPTRTCSTSSPVCSSTMSRRPPRAARPPSPTRRRWRAAPTRRAWPPGPARSGQRPGARAGARPRARQDAALELRRHRVEGEAKSANSSRPYTGTAPENFPAPTSLARRA